MFRNYSLNGIIGTKDVPDTDIITGTKVFGQLTGKQFDVQVSSVLFTSREMKQNKVLELIPWGELTFGNCLTGALKMKSKKSK